MKRKLAELLSRNVIADITLMRCVQGCCFMIAALVFGFGIWGLAHWKLSAVQIFIGFGWTTILPLLLTGSGLLLPLFVGQEDELN